MAPLFSICIPTYKNIAFLKRLLDSISIQTFRDFEVVITDNSPDLEVFDFIQQYTNQIQCLIYHKNEPSVGIVDNWNACMSRATGTWLKLMHADDWFATKDALKIYADEISKSETTHFYFSAFTNIEESDQSKELVRCRPLQLIFLRISPLHLFHKVYVGNPSCTLIHRDVSLRYDNRFKFVVDFEFYIRCFQTNVSYEYINTPLINVGFHREQLTQYTKFAPEVQIPENLLLVRLLSEKIFLNPFVFDYYWRLLRNIGVRSLRDITRHSDENIPAAVSLMVRFQSTISPAKLKIGVISKALMSVTYLSYLTLSIFRR